MLAVLAPGPALLPALLRAVLQTPLPRRGLLTAGQALWEQRWSWSMWGARPLMSVCVGATAAAESSLMACPCSRLQSAAGHASPAVRFLLLLLLPPLAPPVPVTPASWPLPPAAREVAWGC